MLAGAARCGVLPTHCNSKYAGLRGTQAPRHMLSGHLCASRAHAALPGARRPQLGSRQLQITCSVGSGGRSTGSNGRGGAQELAQLAAIPQRYRPEDAKAKEGAAAAPEAGEQGLDAKLGELRKAAKAAYDRIYYGDVLPPIGSFQISYSRLLQLLHDRRVKRLILLSDGRTAIVEIPVENTESNFESVTYDRRDLSVQFAEEVPEWKMEKNRYYVELPGDVWQEGTLMQLIKDNQEKRVYIDGVLRVPYENMLRVHQVRPELAVVDPGDAFVWLNEYSSQFLPIAGLLGLRMVVGAGQWVLRKMGRGDAKKSEQEELAEHKPPRRGSPGPSPSSLVRKLAWHVILHARDMNADVTREE